MISKLYLSITKSVINVLLLRHRIILKQFEDFKKDVTLEKNE